jgi:hypothetical protein
MTSQTTIHEHSMEAEMRDGEWEIAHSAETHATQALAWEFMSNVANWNDPPARFQIDGPFVTGARGTTQMPNQPAQPWRLADVTPMESYTIEFPLDGASLSFKWTFHLYRIERGLPSASYCAARMRQCILPRFNRRSARTWHLAWN